METCYDCIHCEVCSGIGSCSYICSDVSKCKHFKNKADVEEVKQGRWELKVDEYDGVYITCSVCKEDFYPSDEIVDAIPNFCLNCGAKMDGGKEE